MMRTGLVLSLTLATIVQIRSSSPTVESSRRDTGVRSVAVVLAPPSLSDRQLAPSPVISIANPIEDGLDRVLFLHPKTQQLESVWQGAGQFPEIYFAEFLGGAWGPATNLSLSPLADRLPAVGNDAENHFVAWTTERLLRHHPQVTVLAGDNHVRGPVSELTGFRRAARRPGLGVAPDAVVIVAYEEQPVEGLMVSIAVDGVVYQRAPLTGLVLHGGLNTPDIARLGTFQTAWSGKPEDDARVQVHAEDGRLWLDWVNGPGELAWTSYVGGGFGPVQFISFDPLQGDAPARDAARGAALLP